MDTIKMKTIIFLIVVFVQLCFGGPTLRPPAIITAENLELMHSGRYVNVEEISGQFQGDMVLTEEQEAALRGESRTGLIDTRYRWPNNTVPYTLSDVFDPERIAHIELSLRRIEEVTCLRFVKRADEVNYISVTGQPAGCFSYVGYRGNGPQQLNLEMYPIEEFCFRVGTIIHEFLHALGFYHMHSATERDDFVRIAWENIQPGIESNFYTHGADVISNFGELYDVGSVMHYNAFSGTKNGFATIIPHNISLINIMGQREGMSELDIRRVNAMYQCNLN